MPSATRDPLPDALRALALLGVLIVNAAGYASGPWGPVLGDDAQQRGGWAQALQGFYAFAVQGKAYPVLAFLFGMALVMAQRGLAAAPGRARARQRQRRLLSLGVAHGVVVYFGDILTMYGLIGWTLLGRVRARWSLLRRSLRRTRLWTVVVALLATAVVILGAWAPPADAPPAVEPRFATVTGWWAFWTLNASGYLFVQLGTLVLGFASLRLLMLAGIAAARLRWLTHPRWQAQRRRVLRRWAVPALVLNLAYAVAYVQFGSDRDRLGLVEMAGFVFGPLVSMVLVIAVAPRLAAWRRGLHALAPLGRRTLSLYVGHGALCVALFSGVGLGWQPGLVGLLGFSLGLWGLAWIAARASGPRRWPLEAWMARP